MHLAGAVAIGPFSGGRLYRIGEHSDRPRPIEGAADGHMDNVHTLRDTYAADVVALIVEDDPDWCGFSYIMGTVGNAFESSAFCAVKRSCATGYYSFGHELAHIMGARHDWFMDNTNNSPYAYNYGFTKPTPTAPATPWRTVMAYNDGCVDAGVKCDRVQYFSNPNINYPVGGDAMGVTNGLEQADNHQTLKNTALTDFGILKWVLPSF